MENKQSTETDECQNPHGADGIVACWSPGGPCPAGQTVCESCGPCYECRPGEHPCPPAKEADDSQRERFPFTTPHGSDASMFIQWKGTDVCLDFYCECGAHCHFDGDFAYYVKCPHCEAVYEMGTQVIAKRTAVPTCAPKVMEGDERMSTPPGETP